jgi:hypothetical protein
MIDCEVAGRILVHAIATDLRPGGAGPDVYIGCRPSDDTVELVDEGSHVDATQLASLKLRISEEGDLRDARIAVDEGTNTIYTANLADREHAGTMSVINGANCNGHDTMDRPGFCGDRVFSFPSSHLRGEIGTYRVA